MRLVNIGLTFPDLLGSFRIEDAHYLGSCLLIACIAEEYCNIPGKHNRIVIPNIQDFPKPLDEVVPA